MSYISNIPNYPYIPSNIEFIFIDVAKRFYNKKSDTWTEIKNLEEICQVFHIANGLEDEWEEKEGSNKSKKKTEERDFDKPNLDAKSGATQITRKLREIENLWCAEVPKIQDDGHWTLIGLLQAANYLRISCFIQITIMEVIKNIYKKENETWTESDTLEKIHQLIHIVND